MPEGKELDTQRIRERAREWCRARGLRFHESIPLFAISERDAAIEQCCKDVCSYCRNGDVPERRMYSHPPKPFWVHTMIGFDDRTEYCAAGEIHERLGKSAIRARVAAQGEK